MSSREYINVQVKMIKNKRKTKFTEEVPKDYSVEEINELLLERYDDNNCEIEIEWEEI